MNSTLPAPASKLAEVNQAIAAVEERLAQPKTFTTEVYTRIVGYYRSLVNWNKGKREEYRHRRTFEPQAQQVSERIAHPRYALAADAAAATAAAPAASALLFTRPRCPNCPAMLKAVDAWEAGRSLDLRQVNADSDEGFALAQAYAVTAVPTLLLLDAEGRESARILDPRDLK